MSKESAVSLIIVSCAAYTDVLQVLIKKFEELSFFSINFEKIYLATDIALDDIDYQALHIDEVVLGKMWGERVRNTLKRVETEKCLVLLDDYIPTKPLNLEKLKNILDYKGNVDCFYLASVFKEMPSSKNIGHIRGYKQIPVNALYRVNSTVGVWKTESLLEVLADDDSPWEWEAFAGLGKSAESMVFCAPQDDSAQVYFYSYKTGGAVYRGSWVYSALVGAGFDKLLIKNLCERPIIDDISSSKRTLRWKVAFLKQGYSMIGVRVIKFIYLSYIQKIRRYFGK